ncbi:WbqC family protein [Desulfofalx alkaliphila]|uniref:WbqC family protein n=1 Tax=Desulfofalx alkaliphila TaxID=105483 RepID=UPI0004E114F6|nr:WbqC family protein [Desulfofalx alkaliphila]
MAKIFAIHQPNYLPWIGFFHKMMSCDLFVYADDVLMSSKSVTHRNKIKGANGILLLSVPLSLKKVEINRVLICNTENWAERHYQTMQHSYARSPYWNDYKERFRDIYSKKWLRLVDLNVALIDLIRNILDIDTPTVFSSQLPDLQGKKSERIVNISNILGVKTYLSGQGAKVYNDEEIFKRHGLELVYQQFNHPIYPQLWGDFVDKLSVVDLIFNCGPGSREIVEMSTNG